jgi:hypothetical protein
MLTVMRLTILAAAISRVESVRHLLNSSACGGASGG